MNQRYFIVIAASFFALNAIAETSSINNTPTQSNNLESTMANGEKQTTIVDQDGNLKIIENATSPKSPPPQETGIPSETTKRPSSDATQTPPRGAQVSSAPKQPPAPPPPEIKQPSIMPAQTQGANNNQPVSINIP
ncbi:MAG: hypothetical protein A3F11_02490 [Gammaproteobacteria bacterium RIFCSPHIGHO2_12_FULL_37_14]|nr:MAG: hypothetical protein A3F11_02490 [Gammaproteobacteria bacterium RIFCSPHIGHO2_12_FULL_37_14]